MAGLPDEFIDSGGISFGATPSNPGPFPGARRRGRRLGAENSAFTAIIIWARCCKSKPAMSF